jgi:hypothetical protein
MARTVVTTLVDDVDGTPGAETVTFGLDSATYELDLSQENARRLRGELGHWAANARRTGGRRIRGTGETLTGSGF